MKKILILIILLVSIGILGGWWANGNNPYSRHSWVKAFYTTHIVKGNIMLAKSKEIRFYDTPLAKIIFYIQAFFRIEGNARYAERPFHGSEQDIVRQIHSERFDATKPYVISGGHFAEFYVRNFGIFYSAILDPRFALSLKDWQSREQVTLETVATHLELLRLAGKEYTTFVPVSSNGFVGANFNAQPSDSLFAVFYTLSALTNDQFIPNTFPATTRYSYPLQTKQAGGKLLTSYSSILTSVTNTYLHDIIDSKTGLIKTTITLSSARDGIARQSSFYDNVIAWSTAELATQLGLTITCPVILEKDNTCDFVTWKQKIITAFWDEKTGIFLDDLSIASKKNHIFSGDAFITTSTGFLDLQNNEDTLKVKREITYVQAHRLDKPFPLHYALQDQPDKLYFFVRYFATSYMGKSIWSHWGMEYIKTLILLRKDNPEYLVSAQQGLAAYKHNIETYGGYAELYNSDGTIFKTPFYKSILHTGWVVNYEQANMMLQSLH